MKTEMKWSVCVFVLLAVGAGAGRGAGVIIDHNDTDITAVPQAAMQAARDTLHIGYGHTSHGSQLTTGMTGLVGFANAGGLGLSLPPDFFAWNNGGAGGALDLEEGDDYGTGWLDHDCGYYPNWVNETRTYLDDASHADVNVIMWSWCGQVGGKYAAGTLQSEYLGPMSQLEIDYPDVKFVYMTGHVDHLDDANNKAANQMIRDYCIANAKILYDFADIESWDPDGTYYEFPHDDCSYYSSASAPTADGNWAVEWQNSHTQGEDWYPCDSAHSQPLNANRKAYAAWALFAAMAQPPPPAEPTLEHEVKYLGDGKYGITFTVCGNDDEYKSFFVDLTFEGANGGEIQQILAFGSSPVDSDAVAALLDGVPEADYDMDRDSYFLQPFPDNRLPPGIVEGANSYSIRAGTGGASSYLDVGLAYIVTTGDVCCEGTISRSTENYDVLLTAEMPVPGDVNLDEVVDGADYTAWADYYGQTDVGWAEADFNGDDLVDGADYTVLADFYNSDSAAPEPATAALMALGLVALLRRRSR